MTATPTTTREAEAYLAEVRNHLGDLGEDERAELLEDLAQHLADISSDEGSDEADLRERLGDPASYAAELRSAAGLPARTEDRPQVAKASLAGRATGLWNHPRSVALRKLGTELAPAWWVMRALLAVALVLASSPDRWRHIPIPQVYGSRLLGLFIIGVAVIASVAAGRAGYGGWKRVILLGDVFVALGALLLGLQALSMGYLGGPGSRSESVVYVDNPVAGLESSHGPVTNIYPYDAQGRALDGVLLYDQDGRPLRAGRQEWWPDGCERAAAHPRAADGVPVEFAYPYKYRPFDTAQVRFDAHGQPLTQSAVMGCLAEIPRPPVPVPVFPAPAAAPAAAPAGQAPPP